MGERLTRDRSIVLPLDGRQVSVGRDLSCDVVLSGVGVSRRHALITLVEGAPRIADAGSSFGTRVNGAAVREAALADGAVVTIGVVRFAVGLASRTLTLQPLYEEPLPGPAAPLSQCGSRVVRIGRDPASDIHCPHPLVSRFHAAVQIGPGSRLAIADQQSTNGTFVNGRAVRRAELRPGDIVQVGPYRFLAEATGLAQADDYSRVRIEAAGLRVRRGGRMVLDNVSLTVEPGQFVAILGPSGAGKSTLAHVLSGQAAPDEGEVWINAMPLEQFASAFSTTIGFVSQHTLLPQELTVGEVFTEQSLLRLPADSLPQERAARIAEVIALLDLGHVAAKQVRTLSGGEARRVHLGIELLASPALVFLDEPLAGLDFGLIRSFMLLFRAIADRGCTVLLTTHTLEQLELCDSLLFLNRGGLVYRGAPSQIRDAFGVGSIAEVYEKVKRENITRLDERAEAGGALRRHGRTPPALRTAVRRGAPFLRQVAVLLGRYHRTFVRDRRNMLLVTAQAPLIALLLAVVFRFGTDFFPLSFYFAVAVSAIWVGGVNTVREVAREWPMLFREYRAGLSPHAYMTAKAVYWIALTALQGLAFAACIGVLFRRFALDWQVTLMVTVAAAGGALLGLCVSALSAGVNRAVSMLPIVLIPQIFFAGALMPFDRMEPAGRGLSHLTLARPVFALLKRARVLEQGLGDRAEWLWLAAVAAGLSILAWTGVCMRARRGGPAA